MPNMYDHMEFPPYEFRAFPRAVPIGPDGKPSDTAYEKVGKRNVLLPIIEVQSQEELDVLMGGDVALVDGRIRTEDDDRAALYLAAEKVGAKIDKRWTVEKIAAEIEAHKQRLAAS